MPCTPSQSACTSGAPALLRVAKRRGKVEELRAQRDQLIAGLADVGVRLVDIADVLGVVPKTIWDARNRGRER